MVANGLMGGFYRLSEWVMRLAYVNILWMIFTLLGAIVLGIGPATAGMFAVIRKMVMGDDDISVFKIFWSTYRKEFKRANILTFLVVILGFILYFDSRFFQSQEGMFFYLLRYFTLGLFIMYLLVLFYIFPLFAHYQMKILHYLRSALLFAFMQPIITILMVAGNYVVYRILMAIPGLIPFFGVSLFSFITMYLAYISFKRVELREENKEKQQEAKVEEGMNHN